jgi:cell wall assembly regulator SMI1
MSVMSEVAEAWAELVAFHVEIGSPIAEHLNPPATTGQVREAESALGFPLHPDAVALFGCADGIDQERWRRLGAAACEVAPLQEFLPLGTTVERARMFRRNAARSELDGLWQAEWFPLFVMEADEAIVIDCSAPGGDLWVVRWEATDVRELGRDLASHLRHNVALMREQGVTWDVRKGELTFSDDEFGYY